MVTFVYRDRPRPEGKKPQMNATERGRSEEGHGVDPDQVWSAMVVGGCVIAAAICIIVAKVLNG